MNTMAAQLTDEFKMASVMHAEIAGSNVSTHDLAARVPDLKDIIDGIHQSNAYSEVRELGINRQTLAMNAPAEASDHLVTPAQSQSTDKGRSR